MTAGSSEAPAPTAPTGRSLPLLIAAGVLVAAVVGVVLIFGVERPPAFEPITAEPVVEPPASIAWIDHERGEPCLRVTAPDGSVREVACGLQGWVVAWNDEGILVRDWSQGDEQFVAFDPVTGSSSTVPDPAMPDDHEAPYPDASESAAPRVDRSNGRIAVRLPDPDPGSDPDPDPGSDPDPDSDTDGHLRGPVLWEGEAPHTYDIVSAVSAPDGSVVALGDNAGRLLLVDADGSTAPRVWTDGVPRSTEFVWEGSQRGDAIG